MTFHVELHTREDREAPEELAARIAETQEREAAVVSAMRFTGGPTTRSLLELGELRAEREMYLSLLFR